jgi:hypothetical protein
MRREKRRPGVLNANARRLWAPRSGLPDLRIKKPISGRPEIGAQFQLWIFSYQIF